MADSDIPLNSGSGGKNLDTESLTGVGGATVERQRGQITGSALLEVARVKNALAVLSDYALVVRPINHSETGTNSSVLATITASTVILAANLTGRVGATIYNSSTSAILYLSWGATCTTSNYSYPLQPGQMIDVPAHYRGAVSGVWSAADGTHAFVTELT